MSSAAMIHREMAEAWNRRDFNAIRNLLHPGYSYTAQDGKEMMGPDAGVAIAEMYAKAFPDGRLEVKRVYVDGNTAVAEMVATGTHKGDLMGIPPTGKPVEVVICNVMDLRDGKIHREREYMDTASILTQIGVMQAPGKAAGA